MKTIEERYELLATRGVHRKFQSGLDRLRTTVCKMSSRRGRDRHDLIKFFCKRRHVTIVVIRATHVNELLSLLLNCAHDFGMTMSRRTNCNSGVAVEEGVTVNIFYPNA